MRYSRPLEPNLLIVHNVGSVVFFVEFEILAGKRLHRERLSFLRHCVALKLELGKHGLTEKRGAEHIEVIREQELAHCGVFLARKHVLEKQHFVHRACNLGNENGVVLVHVVLRFVGIIRVHGMPQLVRYGEYVVRRGAVIE